MSSEAPGGTNGEDPRIKLGKWGLHEILLSSWHVHQGEEL